MASFARLWLVVTVAGLMGVSGGRAETAKKKAAAGPQAQTGCPVAMTAQWAAGLSTPVMVGGAPARPQETGPTQRIVLTLRNAKLGAVTAVHIRVNGWNGVVHPVPAAKTDRQKAKGSRMMELKVSLGPRGSAQRDVWVHGLTSVNSIDLTSVEYADGSSWKPKSADACSVIPDPEMLVSRR